jgi:predicted acylesterase/phospholipase RssA
MPTTDSNSAADTSTDRPRTGLTLSGGGFRATLFHLGVVRYLYEEKLLHKVTHICSVSGGSILAAHLVLNWARYTSPKEQEFEGAARELVDFVRRDVRGRVVRPWLVSWLAAGLPRLLGGRAWTRTSLLQRQYDRLYRGAKMRDLALPDSPDLHLLATSFTTGHLVAFGGNEMRLLDAPTAAPGLPNPSAVAAHDVPVALAVAASSAFPPLFPPVRVDAATFGPDPDKWPQPHYLTDGGVFDNLGIRRLLWMFEGQRLDAVVVSDAQRSLTREFTNEYLFAPGRTSRCVDLMMNRVSWFENLSAAEALERCQGRVLACRLTTRVEERHPFAPLTVHQDAVGTARTDLDDFTPDEIDAIVHHGYAVARAAAGAGGPPAERAAGHKVWTPARADRPARGGYTLRGIGRRKLGLFRPGHWASWALVLLAAFWVLLPVAVIAYQRVEVVEAQKQAAVAQDQVASIRQEDKLQADRVAKKFRMVRLLGDAVISGNPQNTQTPAGHQESADRRRKAWEQFANELRADPELAGYLNNEASRVRPVEKALAGGWPYPPGTERLLLELAKEVRSSIGSDAVGLDALKLGRKELYSELGEVVEAIADPKKSQLIAVVNSRRQFWRLYWGQMALVEGPEVEARMIAFGDLLTEWEETGRDAPPEMKAKLKEAADQLKAACQAELGAK